MVNLGSLVSKAKALPLPAKIAGAALAAMLLWNLAMGGIATVWAKHIAGKALRGIAKAIGEIDRAEEKNAAYEQVIEALGRQAQELQRKIDEQDAEQARLRAEIGKAHSRARAADAAREAARSAAAGRPKIETLEQARDSINKALGYRP